MPPSDQSHRHDLPTAERLGAAFAIGVTLNVIYVVAQVLYGISAHSLALLADAGHNFSDVLGLLLAWCAIYLGKTRAPARRLRTRAIIDSRRARECDSAPHRGRRHHLGGDSTIQRSRRSRRQDGDN